MAMTLHGTGFGLGSSTARPSKPPQQPQQRRW